MDVGVGCVDSGAVCMDVNVSPGIYIAYNIRLAEVIKSCKIYKIIKII